MSVSKSNGPTLNGPWWTQLGVTSTSLLCKKLVTLNGARGDVIYKFVPFKAASSVQFKSKRTPCVFRRSLLTQTIFHVFHALSHFFCLSHDSHAAGRNLHSKSCSENCAGEKKTIHLLLIICFCSRRDAPMHIQSPWI